MRPDDRQLHQPDALERDQRRTVPDALSTVPGLNVVQSGGPGGQTQVLAVFLYNQSFSRGNLGFGSAISVAMLVIVGLLSLIYLRMLREPK